MLELLLPAAALSSLGWSLVSALKKDSAVAAGAVVMALVLGLASAAQLAPLMVWMEGGLGMGVLALTGSYALGSAVAFLVSQQSRAKRAAFVSATLTASLAGLFWFEGLRSLEAVLQHVADPRDAAQILRLGARRAAAVAPVGRHARSWVRPPSRCWGEGRASPARSRPRGPGWPNPLCAGVDQRDSGSSTCPYRKPQTRHFDQKHRGVGVAAATCEWSR